MEYIQVGCDEEDVIRKTIGLPREKAEEKRAAAVEADQARLLLLPGGACRSKRDPKIFVSATPAFGV